MQQLSRTCLVADHYSKAIEYVCVFPQCEMSRFLCSKCALGTSHKHNQSNNSHIVDNRDFYERITININQAKSKQQQVNYNIQKYIVSLKKLMQEIENFLENIQKIIQKVEHCRLQNYNINHLENQLLDVQKYGFNQIDEQSVNNLINIHLDIQQQLENQANLILQNTVKIQEWHLQLVKIKQLLQLSQIKDAKYQIQQIDDTDTIWTGAISNDLKYIVSGGYDQLLKIWDYQSNQLIKSIKLNKSVQSCKFTEDSTLFYAGSHSHIYQFDVQDQFKELYKQQIHNNYIKYIYCIYNKIILTSDDKTIIKTDFDKKQQLLKIQTLNSYLYGLDYNKRLNIIVIGQNDQFVSGYQEKSISGYQEKSIKLWNGNDGSLIIKKLNVHKHGFYLKQVFFIIDYNQLISLDDNQNLIIWDINYETKQLKQLQLVKNSGYNLSLVLEQQYILATGHNFIKIYTIKGEFVRQFDYKQVQDFYGDLNTIQIDSMKAVLTNGQNKLYVCKQDMD